MHFIESFFGTNISLMVPVILNLILLESLVSVDNAVALAAMVMKLKPEDRQKALSYGIFGAYFFRGLCLLFASFLYQIAWLKALGGLYLIWICAKHFKNILPFKERGYHVIKIVSMVMFVFLDKHEGTLVLILKIALALYSGTLLFSLFKSFYPTAPEALTNQDKKITESEPEEIKNPIYSFIEGKIGIFWATVVLVEMLDLAFSIDNVFAAVALTDKLGLIYLGVFIGILAMRIAAQVFVGLIEKYPFLADTAFFVIGLLGIKLMLSYGCDEKYRLLGEGFCHVVETESADMFVSIITILIFAIPIITSMLFNFPKKNDMAAKPENA